MRVSQHASGNETLRCVGSSLIRHFKLYVELFVSIDVIPLLAIRKTAMFTPSSLAYLSPHALLKSPRSAIISGKNGIPGMLLLLRKGLQEGTLQFRTVYITGISRQHYIHFGRNTTSVCFDLLLGLSPVINGSSRLTLRQSNINLGD